MGQPPTSSASVAQHIDSAIPNHLVCSRTRPAQTPPDFQPPYPAYCVQFPENASHLTFAIIGAQYKAATDADGAAKSTLSTFLTSSDEAPSFFEWASVTDQNGCYNLAALAYWPSKATYEAWAEQSGFRAWWLALSPEECQHGWFLEVFSPTMDRFETLFNTNDAPKGSAHMGKDMSGAVREHGYWGSMRDRLPASQTNGFAAATQSSMTAEDSSIPQTCGNTGGRITIPGKKNLTVIRSGQDWHATTPEERELYLATMHPVLSEGMRFLRDHGEEVGCYSCRFMDVVDPATAEPKRDHTFGLAFFDNLSSLERWAKEHPTHLAIFGGFHQYAKKLQNNVTLRVYHEVMVLEPDQQVFEYVACHPRTGMLVTHQQ